MRLPALLSVLQAAIGTAVAARPEDTARLAAGRDRGGGSGRRLAPPAVVRILGLRMMAQAMMVGAARKRHRDVRSMLLLGASVDTVHAASMVLLARWKPAYRRSAFTSAGVAGVSAGAGLIAAAGRRS